METDYSANQSSKRRRGLVLAAGIIAIIMAASSVISGLVFIFGTDWFIEFVIDMVEQFNAGAMPAEVRTALEEMKGVFIASGVLTLLLCIPLMIAGVKFVGKYSKITDNAEFESVRTPYIVWTIVLFLTGGLLCGILAVIPLFTDNGNKNAGSGNSSSYGTNIDSGSRDAVIEAEINRLKDMKANGLITEEEYSKLVVGIISEKK